MKTGMLAAGRALAVALVLGPLPVWAQQQTATATGTGSDGALSAKADFTFGSGTLTVTLANLLAPNVIGSAGQALSDLTFTLSNPVGTLGATSASGQLGNVSGTPDIVTYVAGTPTRFLGVGGGVFTATGNSVTLEVIGGGQPRQMILPFLADGGTYTSGNNGLRNFSPYVIGPATFTLALSGVTANTRVTSATFSFGTSPDTFLQGTVGGGSVVPEPASLGLVGLGLLGVGVIRRRRNA